MLNIYINKNKVNVLKGMTILQACEQVGLQIPRFCYHDKLSIAGNCRMCLVEVEKAVKPIASCGVNVSEGMSIFTETSLVIRARQGVMEFLLANHPLDCPICDQGGECDLQDQALIFGNDRGRFYEVKRSVANKNCGPLIKTIMTRCIHCTRCIRFSEELSGLKELGTTGRGIKTEIGNYLSKSLLSEVSGNVIDLCPVGALTSKPYSFTSRPWELRRVESIDLSDTMCSNIAIQVNKQQVLRILPVLHEGINEEWLQDKARFHYDGLRAQRLLAPLLILSMANSIKRVNWIKSLISLSYTLSDLQHKSNNILLGHSLSLEATYELLILEHSFSNITLLYQDLPSKINTDFRAYYTFNSTYRYLSQISSCLLIGVDLKKEAPLLLIRLRKAQSLHKCKIFVFGNVHLNGLHTHNSNNNIEALALFLEGKHKVSSIFCQAKTTLVIVGNACLQLKFNTSLVISLLNVLTYLGSKFETLSFLYYGVGKYNGFELGIGGTEVTNAPAEITSLDATKIRLKKTKKLHGYVSSHGNRFMENSKHIYSVANSLECKGQYVNSEGRIQAVQNINTQQLETYKSLLVQVNTYLGSSAPETYELTNVPFPLYYNMTSYASFVVHTPVNQVWKNCLLMPYVSNFYITDSIGESSLIMSKISNEVKKQGGRPLYNLY